MDCGIRRVEQKKSRSLFAQHQLQKAVTEEIGRELSGGQARDWRRSATSSASR